MRAVLDAYGRALASQFSARMLLLSVAPFLLSVALWAVLLYVGFQPLLDLVQSLFAEHGGYGASAGLLSTFGMGMLKTVVVPLVAMLLLLPLMILTALLFMGVAAMPALGRHVAIRMAARHGPLGHKAGGSLAGSLATSLGALGLCCGSLFARVTEGDLEEGLGTSRTNAAAPCGQLERIVANARR